MKSPVREIDFPMACDPRRNHLVDMKGHTATIWLGPVRCDWRIGDSEIVIFDVKLTQDSRSLLFHPFTAPASTINRPQPTLDTICHYNLSVCQSWRIALSRERNTRAK